jgi:hypothetical protein
MSDPLPILQATNGLLGVTDVVSKVPTIKRLIEIGQYRIDPYAIADAMIRWAGAHGSSAASGRASAAQSECSKPQSSPSASVKTAPVEPSTTDPIQFRSALAGEA